LKVRFLMAVRDMLPETVNRGYELAGLGTPAAEHTDIWMFRDVDWSAVPRREDEVDLGIEVDERTVESVTWSREGVPQVWLGDFDTDEIGSESEAVEALLKAGWQIDIEA
jgi:hypothetical protein